MLIINIWKDLSCGLGKQSDDFTLCRVYRKGYSLGSPVALPGVALMLSAFSDPDISGNGPWAPWRLLQSAFSFRSKNGEELSFVHVWITVVVDRIPEFLIMLIGHVVYAWRIHARTMDRLFPWITKLSRKPNSDPFKSLNSSSFANKWRRHQFSSLDRVFGEVLHSNYKISC